MKKSQLSKTQLRDLNIFHLILECYGWDDKGDTESLLENGMNVVPEGIRSARRRFSDLEAHFHAPLQMISLHIKDRQTNEKVLLHFFFDDAPERILEWLVEVDQRLSIDGYPDLLKRVRGRAEMVLLQFSETEMYEIKLPAAA
jgi:hypothetical protein